MAIAFVGNWGSAYSGADNLVHGDSVSGVTTPTRTSTAGNLIVLGLILNTGDVLSSLVDSKSNTWVNDGPLHYDANNSSNVQQFIYSAKNILGGASHTITVNLTAVGYIAIAACEYSGMDTAAPFDKTAVGDGTGTALDSGATPTTTQADELLVGVGSTDVPSNTTWTVGGSYTIRVAGAQGLTTLTGIFEERIVSATGAYNAPATLGASAPWAMRIATYQAVAGPAPPSIGYQLNRYR